MPADDGTRAAASTPVDTIVVLGGCGDLAMRYLLPAAAELVAADRFPDGGSIIAVDRDALDDGAYRRTAATELAEHAAEVPADARDELCRRLRYRRGSATEPDDVRAAIPAETGPVAVYLALPNTLFQSAIEALSRVELPTGSRLAVEKPFGVDRADAAGLNALIGREFREDQVFRVDHVLAERTVLGLLGFRFANRVFEPVWNAGNVDAVDIVWDETVALEGRAGYYDRAGALRDMIQNHLLQILAMVAMEPPSGLDERQLRDRRAELFRAVRPPEPGQMRTRSRRARYTAGGWPSGESVPAYVDEPDVDASRGTETFAEVTFTVDNTRWRGVPFRVRTGKALGADRREVVVRFRPAEPALFGPRTPPTVLRLSLAPDAIRMEVNTNGGDAPGDPRRRTLTAELDEPGPGPYSLVLRALIDGDPGLTVRGDEAEECWRIVEPVLAAWSDGAVPMEEYPAGSAGPPGT
ncbi:glucose-6-phosphate 1-dehydrogenase [Haloactinopolyspora alba]|uniref:Glucose-6-phosphate 1-dehydrogenase n=1 Tax=Haloactinopolyspora alba TaxID=648780 RepID=A0A2P8DWH0_9ACTN|nr:glucose-6-phosphate dehydrogenase [Haloactinopolyspora alba]PSL01517.1 glucose-6-phosphate 1-dehydrogenase [Haloactinopolyspora alba]